MLYPLLFHSRLVEKLWGGRKLQTLLGKPLPAGQMIGESWELYDLPPGVVDQSDQWISSVVANGPLAGRTLHWLIGEFGPALLGNVGLLPPHGQFPILIKLLDAKDDLSIQVHPDAAYADTHPETRVTTGAWYVVQANSDTRIYKGLVPGTSRSQVQQALADGAIRSLINTIAAKAGQCHFLPSGTLHALGAGALVAQVQTPGDTTFRLFDYARTDPSTGQPRPLHVQQALQCLTFPPNPLPAQPRAHTAGYFTTVSRLVTCPNFTIEKVRFSEGVEEPVPYDQPVVWMLLEGRLQVQVADLAQPLPFQKGDTILLPAQMNNPVLKTLTDCIWLEVTFPSPEPNP